MAKLLESPVTNMSKTEWLDRLKQEAITFYNKVQKDAENRQKKWEMWV